MKRNLLINSKKIVSLIMIFIMIFTSYIPFIPTQVKADTRTEISRVNLNKVSGTTEAVYGQKIVQPIVEIVSSNPSGAFEYLSLGTGGYAANWYHDGEYVAPGNTFGEGNYYLQISVNLSGTGQSKYKWADDTRIIYLNGTRFSSSGVTDSRIINELNFNIEAPDGTPPTITTTSLDDGNIGEEYSATLKADGSKPISWNVRPGTSLPNGLSLTSDGKITGTPTVSGTFTIKVLATNSYGTGEKELSLRIKNVQKITKINLNKVSGTTEAVYGEKIVQPVLEIASTEPADAINYLSLDDVHAANWYKNGDYVAPGNKFGEGEYYLLVSINLSGTGQSKYKWSDEPPIYLNDTQLLSSASGDSYIRNELRYNVSTTSTTHTVRFFSNGGSSISSEEVVHGSKATRPTNPTRNGYVFVGWYSDSSLTKPFDFYTNIYNNKILYAKWNEAISTPNATVTPEPAVGLTIGDLTVASSDINKFTVTPSSVCWKLNDSGSCLSNSTQIEAGKTYTLYLTYYPNDGYSIPDNATFTVNGKTTQWSGFEAIENRKINFTIPEDNTYTITIKSYDITSEQNNKGGKISLTTDHGTDGLQTVGYSKEATKNSTVTINATPDEDYEFVGWRKNGLVSPTQIETPNYEFTATKEVTWYAMFKRKSQKVSYTTHVQSYGWQDYVSNGEMSGTSGQAKRLEGIKIKLENQEFSGDIEYRTHIQSYGWEETYKKNDDMSGTEGQAKRLEAIQIRLTGEMATYYDVYYRVHAQTFGWLGWARNDEEAGTAGFAKRLEGIEIKLVPKGTLVPGFGAKEAYKRKYIEYTTHVQTYGWQDYTYDGNMAGTSGEAKRLEGIKIKLNNPKYTGDVEYRTHIQTYGWEKEFKKNDDMSGTSGEAKRLEAIEIKLTGEMAEHYDIYYRVHAQSYGWLNWAKNGEQAGTAGLAKRLEGIEIVLVDKGQSPPVRENQNNELAFIENK